MSLADEVRRVLVSVRDDEMPHGSALKMLDMLIEGSLPVGTERVWPSGSPKLPCPNDSGGGYID